MSSLAQPSPKIGSFARPTAWAVLAVLAAGAAFGVYWFSAYLLAASGAVAITKFGADSFFYIGLAEGQIVLREARFHPVTVVLALAWMKIFSPLTVWISPQLVLKAMFATIGALGVAAATWAFSAVVPRRLAIVCGLIYAGSLGVWYFASIEESKIITASLSALYIAIYLHLRDNWTRRGAVFLTATLLVACLNEIVAGFLILIPFVDTLVRRGWDFRHGWWIAVHGLVGPAALIFLEFVVNGRLVPRDASPEAASEFSHFFYWLSQNYYSVDSLYSYWVKWLFFNIAAPSTDASFGARPDLNYGGDFVPALANYLTSPLSAAVAVLACVMIGAIVLPRYRPQTLGNLAGIPSALMAYALMRGIFFMVYLPGEPLVNSAAVVLAHLMLVIIPFAASRFPGKQIVLCTFAVLLFLTNGMFLISQ